jgi:phosphoenolpyruvate-protein phosphotransferase (PTS system enzyme I)
VSDRQELRLVGLGLSEGHAVGRVCMFNEARHKELPAYKVTGTGASRECGRIRDAIARAEGSIEETRRRVEARIGPAEARIFGAQKAILLDPELHKRIFERVRESHDNAETAIAHVLDLYEAQLRQVGDEYISERATDIGEVKLRLLDALGRTGLSMQCDEGCVRGKSRIIVAYELTPGMTVSMDTEHTLGFVTERGGTNSHAAILARALGIPAVGGIPGVRDQLSCGEEILLDGSGGVVVLRPEPETVRRVEAASPSTSRIPDCVAPVQGFRVMANLNRVEDASEALRMQAEGVGLYRTEFELIAAGRFLSEDEMTERYAALVAAMAGHPVTLRLFDIGSDKVLPFMDAPAEENPSLGWRGTRLLLGHETLLSAQARAVARASAQGPIRVLYPMIVDVAQFLLARERFREAVDDVEIGEVEHGAMFEVPSACLEAEELFDVIDFGSIGTNDLVQYLFAVDRDNEKVAYDYQPDRPVLWELIGRISAAADAAGKALSVCGELGGDPRYVARLMDAGIRTVSTSPRRIPRVRAAAAAMSP